MFGLLRRCQQFHKHDPILKYKLYDTLEKACNVSTIVPAAIGGKAPLYKVYTSNIQFQVDQAPIILLHITKPTLCYGCEIWSITGGKTALAELKRTQIGFLKMLLGVQMHTKTLHVLTEFGRNSLQLSWHALPGNYRYLERLEKMDTDRMLKQAFIADCSVSAGLSWRSLLEAQLEEPPGPKANGGSFTA